MSDRAPASTSELLAEETAPGGLERLPLWVRLLFMLAVLFLFFVSISLMGGALKLLTKSTVFEIMQRATEHPVVGLLLGILATSIIQSSSTTTSIVVGFAATGMVSIEAAIPMVMGANIGTTVTNTIVSFAHVRRRGAFRRALAAGTVHDFFNILATLVLFPLELATHVIQKSAVWVEGHFIGTSFGKVSGLKVITGPIVKGILGFFESPWFALAIALVFLFVALTLMVKIMRSIFVARMAKAMDRVLFRNAFSAFIVGILFTVLVQSSSVTTSLVVPLVGGGILTLRQVFPYMLGANVGTTITAFLAALAFASTVALTGDPALDGPAMAMANAGVTVAVVHLLFNIFGIVVVYPVKFVPIWLAETIARYMTVNRKRVVLFLICYFLAYLLPLVLFLFF